MTKSMTQLTGINPFFIVASLANSVAFYMEGLVFQVRYSGPADDPYFEEYFYIVAPAPE